MLKWGPRAGGLGFKVFRPSAVQALLWERVITQVQHFIASSFNSYWSAKFSSRSLPPRQPPFQMQGTGRSTMGARKQIRSGGIVLFSWRVWHGGVLFRPASRNKGPWERWLMPASPRRCGSHRPQLCESFPHPLLAIEVLDFNEADSGVFVGK